MVVESAGAQDQAPKLPPRLLYVRKIGDEAFPYWVASSRDGVHVLLEEGERVLFVGDGDVSLESGKLLPVWDLPEGSVVMTDRRIVYLSEQWHKVTAVDEDSVHELGSQRLPGGGTRVAIGHARYSWLTEVVLRVDKPLMGGPAIRPRVVVQTRNGPLPLQFSGREMKEDFTRLLARTVAAHRLERFSAWPAEQERALRGLAQGGGQTAARKRDLAWRYPGDVEKMVTEELG